MIMMVVVMMMLLMMMVIMMLLLLLMMMMMMMQNWHRSWLPIKYLMNHINPGGLDAEYFSSTSLSKNDFIHKIGWKNISFIL